MYYHYEPYRAIFLNLHSINWAEWVSIIVLAFTLYWLIKYTRATEKMVENQMTPAVDVNMIFSNHHTKTYFWFLNSSNIPAYVTISPTINGLQKNNVGPLRIAPDSSHLYYFKRTAPSFEFFDYKSEFKSKNKIEMILRINVESALDNSKTKTNFTKSYKFNWDNSEWDETSWGYPDIPFPGENK